MVILMKSAHKDPGFLGSCPASLIYFNRLILGVVLSVT